MSRESEIMRADGRDNDMLPVGRFDLNFHLTRTSNVPSMIARFVSPTLLVLTALVASCAKPEIKTYRVAKESGSSSTDAAATSASRAPSASAPSASEPSASTTPNAVGAAASGANAMAQTAVPTAGGSGLTWTAPSHWKPKPSSAMRKAVSRSQAKGGSGPFDHGIPG
jgi:hypothetical protein